MSDAKQDRPDWGFTGNLVACEERTTKAGKLLSKIKRLLEGSEVK